MIVLNFRLLFNLTLLFPTPSLPPVEPILTPSLEVKLQPRGNFVFLYKTVTKTKEMLVLILAVGLVCLKVP